MIDDDFTTTRNIEEAAKFPTYADAAQIVSNATEFPSNVGATLLNGQVISLVVYQDGIIVETRWPNDPRPIFIMEIEKDPT